MNSFTLIVALSSIALSAAQIPEGYFYSESPIIAPITAPMPNYKTENFRVRGRDYIPMREGTHQYIGPEGIPVTYGYRPDENDFVVKSYPLPIAPAPHN